MPLTRIFGMDSSGFANDLDSLERRQQFIRELAAVILPAHEGFESVWSVANRVYDRHCPPSAGSFKRRRYERPSGIALSA
jgi:hypothetical protein